MVHIIEELETIKVIEEWSHYIASSMCLYGGVDWIQAGVGDQRDAQDQTKD